MYTAVLRVRKPYLPSEVSERFKDPVLIISTEKYKEKLFSSLSGIDTFVPDYEALKEEAHKEWAESADED